MTERNDWLTARGVDHHLETVPLDLIDRGRSHHNQARDEPIDPELVEQYAAAMVRGDVFPPIVLTRHGRRLVVIDGNHRVDAALLAGVSQIRAWIVNTTPTVETELTYEANVLNGRPNTRVERFNHAVHLVTLGMSHAGAAATTGLTKSLVTQAVAARHAKNRATGLGVPADFALVRDSTLGQVNRLKFDEPFAYLARQIAERPGHFGTNRVRQIVNAVRGSRSEREMLDSLIVAINETAPATAGKRTGRVDPWARAILRHLAACQKTPDPDWVKAIESETHRKQLLIEFERTVEALFARMEEARDA